MRISLRKVVCAIGLEARDSEEAEGNQVIPEPEISLQGQVHALQGVMKINEAQNDFDLQCQKN